MGVTPWDKKADTSTLNGQSMTLTSSNIFFSAYDKPPSLEKQLIKDLMANYTSIGINGRPINNMSVPITVSFGLGLIQMDLNEKDKILTTSMWSLYVSTKFSQLSFSCFANIRV